MSPCPKKKHLEGDIKADVKKVLDEFGWFWWMPPANSFGKSGAPFPTCPLFSIS